MSGFFVFSGRCNITISLKSNLKNDRAEATYISTVVYILLVMIMTWVSSEITFIGIRNTVKNELTNVSIRISGDTYKAMREGNLDAYYKNLTEDASYKVELESLVKTKIASAMPLTSTTYTVDNISLTFAENGDNIEYIFHCDMEYYLSLFGDNRTVREDNIRLSGKHNLKAY